MRVVRRHSPASVAAARTLGHLVSAGRRERGWTTAELSERLGTTQQTLRRIERGEPSVSLGLVLDAAVLCGVDLFGVDASELSRVEREARTREALLPRRVRAPKPHIDDDF